MIPIILKELSTELEKLKLESVKINAIPVNTEESLTIIQSKFLGIPYLPLQYEYPKDKNGKPMILIAQINFEEIPHIENYPESGILQLFISSTDWYDMDDYKIIYHDEATNEHQTKFPFLMEDLYEDSPVYCEHKLEFIKTTEFGGTEDHRFNLRFNNMDFYEFCETLTQDECKTVENFLDATGHKIGGYAYFTQSDPRDYEKKVREDILLLQIDTDEQIMFGDSGIANLFIHPDDLKNKNFDKAWFNWDCC
ncbi:YwqG family protein [Sphingobacterium sp. GVS05A]|uniref:YwqG family protein n=1 Tax=Sphingobacterium sp. GVS05A TaxID=2862679 RepID=UPI001CBE2E8E|nr:DUF1963 domain-containing protein [Sphingobacterium sp. GVS05A]